MTRPHYAVDHNLQFPIGRLTHQPVNQLWQLTRLLEPVVAVCQDLLPRVELPAEIGDLQFQPLDLTHDRVFLNLHPEPNLERHGHCLGDFSKGHVFKVKH